MIKYFNKIFKIQFLVLALIILSLISKIYADTCQNSCSIARSRTFFLPRSITTNSTIELALHNYDMYHNNYFEQPYFHPRSKAMLTVQATAFYQQSDSGSAMAEYFLAGHKKSLSVREDGLGNIGSIWLDLVAQNKVGNSPEPLFNSTLRIRPKRFVEGVMFNIHVDFSKCVPGLWLNALFAPIRVQHDMQMNEKKKGYEGVVESIEYTQIRSLQDAFNNPAWVAGKIASKKLTEYGLDDLLLKLGMELIRGEKFHFSFYAAGLLPVGDQPNGEFLFEPIFGNARHTAVGGGINIDSELLRKSKNLLHFMIDARLLYFFKSQERRSFDLCNGDWSRYLLVVTPTERSNSLPGINFFTQDVKVKPKYQVDTWMALHYQRSALNLEAGYNFWWRSKENVALANPWNTASENIGIYDPVGDSKSDPVSASKANISQSATGPNKAPSDTTFTFINPCDINISSARQRSAISHTIYLAAGFQNNVCSNPLMLGLGSSYEFAQNRNTLNNWSIWLKGALSF